MYRFKNILYSELVRNSAKLLSANVVAQVIGLLIYPILTRLYSPSDFGLLNLFLSIGNVLVLFSTAEYQYVIVLCKEERQAHSAAQLSMALLIGFSFVLCLLLPFRESISLLLNISESANILLWLPLFVLSMGMWNILNLYYTRNKQFGAISSYKMGQSVLQCAGKLGFGYGGMLKVGLILSTVLAPIIGLFSTIFIHLRHKLRSLMQIDKSDIRTVAVQYKQFPLFSLPRALVNSLGLAVPALMFTRWFDLGEYGLFSMAITLSFGPISMIVNSVQQVLFQQTAEAVHKRQPIKQRMLKLLYKTLIVVIPCFAILFFILPTLTRLLLGDEWIATGTCIRFMLPWLLLTCLNGPICFIPDIFMEQKIGFVFECIILFSRILGFAIGLLANSFYYSVIGYCAMITLALAAQLVWFYRLISRYEKSIV